MMPKPSLANSEYKVGPGCPPREHQFKPGQSGNPKGAKRKPASVMPDLKALLERALDKKVTLKQGEKERSMTMLAVGIEQLVAQYAKGDRHARRDLFALADQLGVDLKAGQTNAIDESLAENHQAILEAYVGRQYDTIVRHPPVMAPAALLDDDPDNQTRS